MIMKKIEKCNKKRKAQANIITMVLFILLVLGAIIVIWNVVVPLIERSGEKVGAEALTVSLEIKDVELWVTGGARIKVHRKIGEGKITELNFIFDKEDGGNIIIKNTTDFPNDLETKTYDFTVDQINEKIKKVSIMPMFGEVSGTTFFEKEADIEKDENGDRILDAPEETISWWKFDEDFTDSVGGNDGVLQGDANINGNVLNLDGDGDYVDLGDGTFDSLSEASVSIWFKPKNYGSGNVAFITFMEQEYLSSRLGFYFGPVEKKVRWMRANIDDLVGQTEINLEWNHAAVTMSDEGSELYVNGILENNDSETKCFDDIVPGLVNIIGGFNNSDAHFNGTIDDVMIFDRALSPVEVDAVYNNQRK